MAGNTLGDLLKAGQLDLLKQASSDNKASEKKPAKSNIAKPKDKSISSTNTSKDILQEDYRIFHSYVRSVVQKNELYDTMFDYGDEESFLAIAELYDNPACRDIIDYFACCFFNGEYEFLDSIANDCERGNDNTPDAFAVVLGHQVPITYREEYELLAQLCSTAVGLDGRFDDEPQEETIVIYDQPDQTDDEISEFVDIAQPHVPYENNHIKRENTKALRKAQDIINVPKKGSQAQRVKVIKHPTVPAKTPVGTQSATPVNKFTQQVPLQELSVKKQSKTSVTRVVQPIPVKPSTPKNVVTVATETTKLPVLSKSSNLNDNVTKPAQKPKQEAVVKRKLSLEDQHEQKTLELRNHLEYAYKELGIADMVSDLYRKEKYGSIFTFFKVLQKEYYDKQHSLDASTFRILWENAYHYVDVFIRGKKRLPSNPVIGYRKRSFKSHIANTGVWGRIAAYGGTNGRIIRINAGHGR